MVQAKWGGIGRGSGQGELGSSCALAVAPRLLPGLPIPHLLCDFPPVTSRATLARPSVPVGRRLRWLQPWCPPAVSHARFLWLSPEAHPSGHCLGPTVLDCICLSSLVGFFPAQGLWRNRATRDPQCRGKGKHGTCRSGSGEAMTAHQWCGCWGLRAGQVPGSLRLCRAAVALCPWELALSYFLCDTGLYQLLRPWGDSVQKSPGCATVPPCLALDLSHQPRPQLHPLGPPICGCVQTNTWRWTHDDSTSVTGWPGGPAHQQCPCVGWA